MSSFIFFFYKDLPHLNNAREATTERYLIERSLIEDSTLSITDTVSVTPPITPRIHNGYFGYFGVYLSSSLLACVCF